MIPTNIDIGKKSAENRKSPKKNLTHLHGAVHIFPHFNFLHVRSFLLLAHQKFVPHLNRQSVPFGSIRQILWRVLDFYMWCLVHIPIRWRITFGNGSILQASCSSIHFIQSMVVAVNHRIHFGWLEVCFQNYCFFFDRFQF